MKYLKHIFENSSNNYDYEELYNRLKKLSDVIKKDVTKIFDGFDFGFKYYYEGVEFNESNERVDEDGDEIEFRLDNNSNHQSKPPPLSNILFDMERNGADSLDKLKIVHSVYYIPSDNNINVIEEFSRFDYDYDYGGDDDNDIDEYLERTDNEKLTKLINELSKKYSIETISFRKIDGFLIILHYDLQGLAYNITKLYKNL
tara:strand:+ start:1545 stop:2147 length:603 start_codon:yes stop_codon:yes gene_type:complete